jgi:leucine-rich repeat protein SHOC2
MSIRAIDLITSAAKRCSRTIDLSHQSLTAIHPSIKRLTDVGVIKLTDNQFSEFPEHLAELPNLVELDLANNRLSALPRELRTLSALEILDLRGNSLRDLGNLFEAAPSLQVLILDDNELTCIPESIGKLVPNLAASIDQVPALRVPAE